METTAQRQFRVGDRVLVPWGLDTVQGIVMYAYGPPGHPSVMVRVPILGPRGETLDESVISFPGTALRSAAA